MLSYITYCDKYLIGFCQYRYLPPPSLDRQKNPENSTFLKHTYAVCLQRNRFLMTFKALLQA